MILLYLLRMKTTCLWLLYGIREPLPALWLRPCCLHGPCPWPGVPGQFGAPCGERCTASNPRARKEPHDILFSERRGKVTRNEAKLP